MSKETISSSAILSNEEIEAWVFKGLKKPRHSRENIFQAGAPMSPSYQRWVDGGGLDELDERDFGALKKKRLEQIHPTNQYTTLSEWSLDSIHGGKQFVAQFGRSNRYIAVAELLEQSGLHCYEVQIRVKDRSGRGHSSSQLTLRLWMQPGDKTMRVYATDYIEETKGTHTGSIVGGPNSMNSPFSFGKRVMCVDVAMLGEAHLASISTSVIAKMIRSLF